MIRGLYTSGWSMLADTKKMDVISNNLANASTTAYKKDTVITESFPEVLTRRINDTRSRLNPSGMAGGMNLGSDVGDVFTYYTQGSVISTENNLDFAISNSDSAFFTVTPPGDAEKKYYTRDGAFKLNSEGYLVTDQGFRVLGENGPIKLDSSAVSVKPDGTVVLNGEAVDKLLITDFEDTKTLKKVGNNMVEASDQSVQKPFKGNIEQSYLEQSNVDIVREMVNMITVMRSYEANQKMLQAQDSMLDKAVNEVGRLR